MPLSIWFPTSHFHPKTTTDVKSVTDKVIKKTKKKSDSNSCRKNYKVRDSENRAVNRMRGQVRAVELNHDNVT